MKKFFESMAKFNALCAMVAFVCIWFDLWAGLAMFAFACFAMAFKLLTIVSE